MAIRKISDIFGTRSLYAKQVASLASGNVVAAIIPFIFQPVIARLYTAQDFSILGWFMSFVSILSVFATGKYELAIILPKTDSEAKNISFLSFMLTTFFSILIIILSVFFYDFIAKYLKTEEILWIFLVGPGILFFCVYQIFFYMANRYSLYRSMAVSKINQNGGMIILQLVFGLLGAGSIGLIFGRVFGYMISALILGWFTLRYSPIRKDEISRPSMSVLAKSYNNFPKHLILSNFIASVYTQLPFIFIARQYDQETSGQFAFALQMITVPGLLIANAIGDVFRQKASDLFKETGRFDKLLIKTAWNCFLLSVIPYTVLILFSVPIFKLVFGGSWELAGKFASILSLMAFIGFFITPIDKAAIVVNKTSFEFWYHVSRFIANLIIVLLAFMLSLSVFTYLYLLVVITILHYLVDMAFSYKFSLASHANG